MLDLFHTHGCEVFRIMFPAIKSKKVKITSNKSRSKCLSGLATVQI